jgi:hypothetical protein
MKSGAPYREVDGSPPGLRRKPAGDTRTAAGFCPRAAEEYLYELIYCLLTPQSSAVNAGKAVARLKEADFLATDIDPSEILFRKEHYIRFHNTKARRLLEAKTIATGFSPRSARGALRRRCGTGSCGM